MSRVAAGHREAARECRLVAGRLIADRLAYACRSSRLRLAAENRCSSSPAALPQSGCRRSCHPIRYACRQFRPRGNAPAASVPARRVRREPGPAATISARVISIVAPGIWNRVKSAHLLSNWAFAATAVKAKTNHFMFDSYSRNNIGTPYLRPIKNVHLGHSGRSS